MRVDPTWRRLAGVAALAGVLLCAGCWYNTSGRSGGNVGDIYIPFFQDLTTGDRAVNLGTRITQRVVTEFQRDRHIRVYQAATERTLAQKELLGTVRRFAEGVLNRDPDQTTEEYRVVVECAISYKDLQGDKMLWQSSVSGDGNYQIAEGEAGFERALNEAIEEIIAQIVDKTIKAW
jgi:hypothetical protein